MMTYRLLGYFGAHWRGELSMAKSILLNGLLAYVLLVAAFVSAGQVLTSPLFFFAGMAVFLAWGAWAIVGIGRCAIKSLRADDSSFLRKVVAVFALILVVTVVVFSLRDLWNIIIEPMTRQGAN